jgi:hypothetical protein
MERDMTIKAKYSVGPNFKANLAKAGAKKTRMIKVEVPAMKDPIAEILRAKPALPFRAI